jgi:transcriptional regulator with XRE-family HTH domain
MKIHDKIKYAREKMGWTIDRLAKKSGVHWEYIMDAEGNRRELKMSELSRIANALHRSVDWFLSEDEPDDPVFLHCKGKD